VLWCSGTLVSGAPYCSVLHGQVLWCSGALVLWCSLICIALVLWCSGIWYLTDCSGALVLWLLVLWYSGVNCSGIQFARWSGALVTLVLWYSWCSNTLVLSVVLWCSLLLVLYCSGSGTLCPWLLCSGALVLWCSNCSGALVALVL
jgi:hypothetical protein